MSRFKKGESGNPEGRPAKKKPGQTLAHEIVVMSSVNMPEFPGEQQRSSILNNEEWQPFGSDNLFPQANAQLSRKSPSHRGILNWKTIYCSGKGFLTDEKNKKLAEYIKAVNPKESLKNVGRKGIFDYLSGGNAYFELVKVGEGRLNIFHKDYTTARIGKDGKNILLHGDWASVNGSRDKIKKIPIYPVFEEIDGSLRSIYHFKSYEPEFKWYGIPDWISAMDAAGIAYKTNKWNISRLDNSFLSSGTLIVEGNVSAKEAKKMKEDFKKEFTGEGKQGKVFFLVKQLGGGSTTFTPFSNVSEGDWLQLHKQADQDLVIAHSWFRSLSGLGEAGQLGNTQQIRNEYQIAKNTVIADIQEFFLEGFKKIIKEQLKLEVEDLQYKNEMPLSIMDLLDPKTILTKNEQRKLFNYEEIEESATNALNGAQVQAMVQVLTSAANGQIPRETAVQVIVKAFGLSEEDAEAIVDSIGKGFKPIKEEE